VALSRASKSLRDLRVAEVVKLDLQLDAKGRLKLTAPSSMSVQIRRFIKRSRAANPHAFLSLQRAGEEGRIHSPGSDVTWN